MAYLEVDGVHKRFGSNEVLRGVDVDVDPHQVVCLIGASGSGKSTLLRCINALEDIDDGVIRLGGGSVRSADEDLAALPAFRNAASNRPLKGWLAAALTALDGSELGAIQLFDKLDGSFTESDEAVLIHLAQMASAAVERARLYQERG